jgi:hypothetical protein
MPCAGDIPESRKDRCSGLETQRLLWQPLAISIARILPAVEGAVSQLVVLVVWTGPAS